MTLVKRLRYKAARYLLNKELIDRSRAHQFHGFENSKSVGILFNATDPEDLELVRRYVKYLKDYKKRVKAIGYFTSREVPELVYSKLEYDFFTKRDLNWHFKPTEPFVDQFINEEFDLLIDLNLKNNFPLNYISKLSKAKFKIGKYSEEPNDYDFMIEIPVNKGIKFFLKNFDLYIQQISSTQTQKK